MVIVQGWIKLHRKLLDNPVVCKDGDHIAVWIYLLLNATHQEYPALFGGKKITLLPGQLITGRKSISDKLSINESKVQRILKTLENEQQIEQQTNNKHRLITILRWDYYQEDEQQNEHQVNNERTTTEQQVNTNKNVKNIRTKEVINKYNYAEFVTLTDEEYQKLVERFGEENTLRMIDVLDNYKGATGKKYKSDYRAILGWVSEKVLEGDKRAINRNRNATSKGTAGKEKEGNPKQQGYYDMYPGLVRTVDSVRLP